MVPASRIMPYLAALAAPLLVQLVWLLHNTQLPISDATGSLLATHELSQLALQGKWAEFIRGLYTIRDWRPTALCLVQMPFCVLSGGNLMFTAGALTLTSTFISVTYIYLLLRLALTPRYAALAAATLGLMPVVQWPATYFGLTETPFLAAMLAALYHLLRAEDFTSRRHSYAMAVAATLAFMLRPIETLLQFTPVLFYGAWRAHKRGALGTPALYTTLTLTFAFASVLALAGWWPEGLFVMPESAIFNIPEQGRLFAGIAWGLFVTTIFLFVFLLMRGLWRGAVAPGNYFLRAVTCMSLAVCLWYMAFMVPLVQWIYITNLGELSHITQTRGALGKIAFFIACTGAIPLGLIALLAAVAYLRSRELPQPLLALLALMPIPLITPFISCQYSQRKMTVLFTCLLLVLLPIALQPGALRRARTAIIGLLAACQCTALVWIGMGNAHTEALALLIGSPKAYPDMVTTRPNPHDTLIAFMEESAARHGYHSIALPILAGEFVPRIADPFLLHILMEMRSKELGVFLPHITDENEDGYEQPGRLFGGDAFIVIPDRKLAFTSEEAARYRALAQGAFLPSDKAAYAILALHAENKLESEHVHKRDCAVIAPTDIEACIYDYKP